MEEARKKSEEQGVTFELSEAYLEREKELQEKIDELSGQIDKNQKTLDELIEQEVGIFNSVAAEQQGDAWREYGEEMAKCLEIARRISRGDRVPAQDEKKLMDFNMDIYKMAKEMAAVKRKLAPKSPLLSSALTRHIRILKNSTASRSHRPATKPRPAGMKCSEQ